MSTNTTPGGRCFVPVVGDEFYLAPGVTFRVMADADIEVILSDGIRITTLSGKNFYLCGPAPGEVSPLYRVVNIRQSSTDLPE